MKNKNQRSGSVKKQVGNISPHLIHHPYIHSKRQEKEKDFKKLEYSLSPYLGQHERRRKVRSVVNDTRSRQKEIKKIYKEASSKRFRIQQLNYHPNKNSSQYLKTISHKSQRGSNKSIRHQHFSLTKYQNDLSAYTQKPVQAQNTSLSKPTFYSELYEKLKMKNQSKRDNKFRRGKYIQSSLEGRTDPNTTTAKQTAVLQFGFTTNNIQSLTSGGTTISHQRAERRNFRKNKFDMKSQTINETNKIHIQQMKYNSAQIQKKESNSSLMRELECQTQKDIQIQEKTTKIKMNRILQKSLQRSTEQYFKQSYHYRKLKSKNDIQTYISTVKNPTKNRNSQASTHHASDLKRSKQVYISEILSSKNKSLNYNFDIEDQIGNVCNPMVIQESQSNTDNNQESLSMDHEIEFNKQRKQAQRAKFEQCDVVGISWSFEQLQFNKLNTHQN